MGAPGSEAGAGFVILSPRAPRLARASRRGGTRLLLRTGLVVATFLIFYWSLGHFRLLRNKGWGSSLRWLLAGTLAFVASGYVALVR